MLLAGMATRIFSAMASLIPKKPIQSETASGKPYRKTNPSVVRLASVFMPHSFQSAVRETGGV
jgi:hypothetical protein